MILYIFLLTSCSAAPDFSDGDTTGAEWSIYSISDYFGKDAGSSYTPSLYASYEDMLIGNYDIKEVEEAKQNTLPEYDLAGPVNGGVKSDGLKQVVSITPNEQLTKDKAPLIYLAPGHNAKQINVFECLSESAQKKVTKSLRKEKLLEERLTDRELEEKLSSLLSECYTVIKKSASERTVYEKQLASWYKNNSSYLKIGYEAGNAAPGAEEVQVTWGITKYLAQYLREAGYEVVVCRTERDEIDKDSKTYRARALKANELSADLHLSIHAAKDTLQDGKTEKGFYFLVPKSTAVYAKVSKKIAETLRTGMNDNTTIGVYNSANYSNGIGEFKNVYEPANTFTDLNWSTVPIVIAECGFLVNEHSAKGGDFDKLVGTANYKTIAKALYKGIVEALPLE